MTSHIWIKACALYLNNRPMSVTSFIEDQPVLPRPIYK